VIRGQPQRPRRQTLLRSQATWRLQCRRATPPGRRPDQRLADMTLYSRPAGRQWWHDVGMQACLRDGVERMHPRQKPRGHVVPRAHNVRHRTSSRRRGRLEPVNSRVTRGRMRQATSRVWTAGMRDRVRAIGCALPHVRVRLTPSWTPMASIVMNSNSLAASALRRGARRFWRHSFDQGRARKRILSPQ
jgi:hypothetical protein